MTLAKHASKSIPQNILRNIFTQTPIKDIKSIPQTGNVIFKDGKAKSAWITKKGSGFKSYIKDYFSVWHTSIIKKQKAELLKSFTFTTYRYAEDFSVLPQSWYKELLANANFSQLGSLKQKAMVINNTSLRSMPTIKPAYYNPHQAGEGYPFDTLQGNLLHVGEPILISHFTKDGTFALVETNAQSHGFIEVQNLALVDDKTADNLLNLKYCMVAKENLNLYDTSNSVKFTQKVYFSTFLPIKNKADQLKICLPIKGNNGFIELKEIKVANDDIIMDPLAFENSNVARIIDILIDLPYGWGGYLMNRDCAQILQDYFAMFGIHIPIFSAHQIKAGKYISLANVDTSEKLAIIKKQAIPFKTVLYRKGHITLYLGEYKGKSIMFHAVWGVVLYDKNNIEHRHIIGKSVITTLEYGKELAGYCNKRSSFSNLLSAIATFE